MQLPVRVLDNLGISELCCMTVDGSTLVCRTRKGLLLLIDMNTQHVVGRVLALKPGPFCCTSDSATFFTASGSCISKVKIGHDSILEQRVAGDAKLLGCVDGDALGLAKLKHPGYLLATQDSSKCYFLDSENGLVRLIDFSMAATHVSTIAGSTGPLDRGINRDATPATAAKICWPCGLEFDRSTLVPESRLYVLCHWSIRILQLPTTVNDILRYAINPCGVSHFLLNDLWRIIAAYCCCNVSVLTTQLCSEEYGRHCQIRNIATTPSNDLLYRCMKQNALGWISTRTGQAFVLFNEKHRN